MCFDCSENYVANAGTQPAITLLDFFASLAVTDGAHHSLTTASTSIERGSTPELAIEKAQAASAAFRDMPALDKCDTARWVEYWKVKGLFLNVSSGPA
jgi:hypothetical protein